MNSADFAVLKDDAATFVEKAVGSGKIMNVAAIAEKLRRRHLHLNVALEDIEALILDFAMAKHSLMEFDGAADRRRESLPTLSGRSARLWVEN
jgi:hypothetical protein